MVVRIEVNQLFVGFNGILDVTVLDVPVSEDLVLPLGLHHESLFEIESCEPLEDVESLRIQALDLLQDGDGLGGESVPGEVLCNLLVELDRGLELTNPAVQVPYAVDDGGVVRKFLKNLFVLFDSLLELPLLNKLLSVLQNLVPLDGHRPLRLPFSCGSTGGTPLTQPPVQSRLNLS